MVLKSGCKGHVMKGSALLFYMESSFSSTFIIYVDVLDYSMLKHAACCMYTWFYLAILPIVWKFLENGNIIDILNFLFYFIFCLWGFACMHVCVPCACLGFPRSGVTHGYERPLGTGNWTEVLWKSIQWTTEKSSHLVPMKLKAPFNGSVLVDNWSKRSDVWHI